MPVCTIYKYGRWNFQGESLPRVLPAVPLEFTQRALLPRPAAEGRGRPQTRLQLRAMRPPGGAGGPHPLTLVFLYFQTCVLFLYVFGAVYWPWEKFPGFIYQIPYEKQ